MPDRKVRTFHNPDLVFHDKTCTPILELNVDKFPEKYRPDWSPCIIEPTRRWLKKSKYKGMGTIWIIHNASLNFGHEWVHSVFVICQGLIDEFFGYLLQETKRELGDLVTCIDTMVIHEEIDGWSPLVHVEQGRVWRQIDAEEWEEV